MGLTKVEVLVRIFALGTMPSLPTLMPSTNPNSQHPRGQVSSWISIKSPTSTFWRDFNHLCCIAQYTWYWALHMILDVTHGTGPHTLFRTWHMILGPTHDSGPGTWYWTLYMILDPAHGTGPYILFWTRHMVLSPTHDSGPGTWYKALHMILDLAHGTGAYTWFWT